MYKYKIVYFTFQKSKQNPGAQAWCIPKGYEIQKPPFLCKYQFIAVILIPKFQRSRLNKEAPAWCIPKNYEIQKPPFLCEYWMFRKKVYGTNENLFCLFDLLFEKGKWSKVTPIQLKSNVLKGDLFCLQFHISFHPYLSSGNKLFGKWRQNGFSLGAINIY